MVLEFQEFTKAAGEVERIMRLPDNTDLKAELIKSSADVQNEKRKEYYRHMNSLFLNIILNRMSEFGPGAEERTFDARKILVNLINEC